LRRWLCSADRFNEAAIRLALRDLKTSSSRSSASLVSVTFADHFRPIRRLIICPSSPTHKTNYPRRHSVPRARIGDHIFDIRSPNAGDNCRAPIITRAMSSGGTWFFQGTRAPADCRPSQKLIVVRTPPMSVFLIRLGGMSGLGIPPPGLTMY